VVGTPPVSCPRRLKTAPDIRARRPHAARTSTQPSIRSENQQPCFVVLRGVVPVLGIYTQG
jgi:hypothetical protein